MAELIEKPSIVTADAVRLLSVPSGKVDARSNSYDSATRTAEIIAATENPLRMPGYDIGIDFPYFLEILDCSDGAVDLSEMEAGNCPWLDSHQRYSMADRIGAVYAARIENRELILTARLGHSDIAKALEPELASGEKIKASVGYRRLEMRFERMENDVPVYRTTRWLLREVSSVPIAADLNAGVRSAGDETAPCKIMETETMTKVADQVAGAAPVDPADAALTAVGSEGHRAAGDNVGGVALQQPVTRKHVALTSVAALGLVEQARAFGAGVVTRAEELIGQNEQDQISADMVRSEILKAGAEAQRAQTGAISTNAPSLQVTADERDKFLRGAENSLILRAGVGDMIKRAAEMRGEKIDLDPGEFRGIMNVDLARMALDRAGIKPSNGYSREIIVGEALTTRAGGNSTSDFPVLLDNVMHKTLRAAYVTAPDTWSRVCKIGSVSDFRAHNRYLRGSLGRLEKVNEAGEFKTANIPDGEAQSIKADTQGKIIPLTRQAIINDDMSVFDAYASEMGRMAKLSIEVDFYAMLLLVSGGGFGPIMKDNKPFFHADHGNILTPAAPSVASFDDARVKMAKQKDISGNEYIDIRPSIWFGPIELGGEARVINASKYDPDAVNKLERPNKVAGMYSEIVDSPRLPAPTWYNFASPDIAPAFEVVFLNGEQEPFIDQQEGWRIDGREYKVRHDYGMGGLDYRAASRNAGV